MATRALIAWRIDDGCYRAIYLHWDGMPSEVMPTLTQNYNTPEKVIELLALGDLSQLGAEIGEKHTFVEHDAAILAGAGDCRSRWCLSCLRDRAENAPSRIYDNYDNLVTGAEDCDAEYLYIFDAGGWWLRDLNDNATSDDAQEVAEAEAGG